MQTSTTRIMGLCGTLLLAIRVLADDRAGLEFFEERIRPVFVEHCHECHSRSADEIGGGLHLDTRSGLLRGGNSGPAIVGSDVERSILIRALRYTDKKLNMPPDGKLPQDVLRDFEKWISMGAPDPRDDADPGAEERRREAGRSHWSFRAPQAAERPAVERTHWPRSEIDHFVLARLEEKGLQPVGDASRRTLIRRLFFDLIGLPPSPREIAAFLADASPDLLERLIDQLLASPRFGERWGRHWLDVVRFAESSGKEFNFTYPHAWPYRDYVIDALNKDKPYDQFILEQIAGDLLPAAHGEPQEVSDERQIASGLLAFGPKRHNSGGAEFQLDVVDDQIDVTCRAVLGLTVACARCHDHKFDPIPSDDYYALAGIFLSTEPLYGTIKQKYSNNPTALVPIGPDATAKHEVVQAHRARVDEAEKQLASKREELKTEEEHYKQATETRIGLEEPLAAAVAAADDPGKSDGENPGQEVPTKQEALEQAIAQQAAATTAVEKLKAEIEELDAALVELKKESPPHPTYAQGSRDRTKPADTQVAIRGDPGQRGKTVPRGFLSVLDVPGTRPVDPQQSGRQQLAEWLTSSNNPLTARVMVNRVWHHLFGRGLVDTVDDFGTQGRPPSHPELLDTLAVRFMRDGWSVKKLVRAIVLSRVYRLSTAGSPDSRAIDPDSVFLWRMPVRRLEAEAIRDAVLAFSGQLVPQRPSGSTVTALGDRLVREIDLDKLQPRSNHRSVYLPVVRDYTPELFDLFDFPSPSLVNGRRAVTNVPTQALYLRNSEFVNEQAEHTARRLLTTPEATDDKTRVALAFELALGRPASDTERVAALQLIRQTAVQEVENNEPAAGEVSEKDAAPQTAPRDPRQAGWAALCRALVATAEFRYLADIE